MRADVDNQSIFDDAQTPASVLDLKLRELQRSWNLLFLRPSDSPKRARYPLIAAAGVAVEFRYRRDRIEINGTIMNTQQFLSLKVDERKAIVRQTLEAAFGDLQLNVGFVVDKKAGPRTACLAYRG